MRSSIRASGTADMTLVDASAAPTFSASIARTLRLLTRDRVALAAAIVLLILAIAAILGPPLIGDMATKVNLRMRNAPPSFENGFAFLLGADTLGRSLLLRLIVGCRTTLGIAFSAVLLAIAVGGTLGLIAGYFGGFVGNAIMRLADIVMSFPSLLLALVVLYILGPNVVNLVIVLAVTRVPVYLRTTRAEVLELRERMFISAARIMGASPPRIIIMHIVPLVVPTLLTIAAIDLAAVILTESGLSFLGLGIQPPEFTWGAMVATGRNYLTSAWWLAFWPGLAIMITTLSLTVLASWARTINDPHQRWRLEMKREPK
jgi:peptide/nickel transport system permease protein